VSAAEAALAPGIVAEAGRCSAGTTDVTERDTWTADQEFAAPVGIFRFQSEAVAGQGLSNGDTVRAGLCEQCGIKLLCTCPDGGFRRPVEVPGALTAGKHPD